MAGFDPEKLIRVEGNDIWIKATPGRLDSFLCQYFDKNSMEGRNVGAAQRLLALLEYVSGRPLTNDKNPPLIAYSGASGCVANGSTSARNTPFGRSMLF